MLTVCPPMSNAERQRQFCERNPGYYARIKAKERAMSRAAAEQYLAKLRAEAIAASETASAADEAETS